MLIRCVYKACKTGVQRGGKQIYKDQRKGMEWLAFSYGFEGVIQSAQWLLLFVVFKSPSLFLSFSLKVWEFCRVGGSSHTALRRPRQCQLVFSRAQEGMGMRVCFCLFVYVLLRFNRLILKKSGIWIYSWGSPHPPSAFIRYMFSLAHAAERLWMIFPPRFISTCRPSS